MTRGPVSIVFRKRYHRSLCPSKLGFIVQDLSRSSRWTGEVQIDMCHTQVFLQIRKIHFIATSSVPCDLICEYSSQTLSLTLWQLSKNIRYIINKPAVRSIKMLIFISGITKHNRYITGIQSDRNQINFYCASSTRIKRKFSSKHAEGVNDRTTTDD